MQFPVSLSKGTFGIVFGVLGFAAFAAVYQGMKILEKKGVFVIREVPQEAPALPAGAKKK